MIHTIYAFDVDETLEVSGGPILLTTLRDIRARQNLVLMGLCGNFAVVTMRIHWWHDLFHFIGPMSMTKDEFLRQIKTYVPASDYVMVGNILGVSGKSDDAGAAARAGWRFIRESDFASGTR